MRRARSRPKRPPPPPGLAALIHPLSAEAFLKKYWPNKYFSIHGSPTRLPVLFNLPELKNVYALLAAWKSSVTVCLPRIRDEAHNVSIPSDEAEKLYDEGMNLIFSSAQTQIPALRVWLERLVADLGLPRSVYARCLVYASPESEGASWHFDQNVNLVIQIHGTKTWRLAPNKHAINPLSRYSTKMTAPPSLSDYCRMPLPTKGPPKSDEVVLRPGSVLFVPRGWWHTTRSKEESLSLNFTLSQPSWGELAISEIGRRLFRYPHWRELADGAGGKGTLAAKAEDRLDSLLKRLFDDIGSMRADDMISRAGETPPATLKKAPSTRFSVNGTRVTIRSFDKERIPLEIDRQSQSFFRWLDKQKKPFTAAMAESRLPHLTSELVGVLLEVLIQSGALEKAPAPTYKT